MRRKHHEPIPPQDLDEPFGPPPSEYLYRCSICGEEMLVNEAIIDVGMGMAKFQREYHAGFMPKVAVQDGKRSQGSNSQPIDFESVKVYPIFRIKIENYEKSNT